MVGYIAQTIGGTTPKSFMSIVKIAVASVSNSQRDLNSVEDLPRSSGRERRDDDGGHSIDCMKWRTIID